MQAPTRGWFDRTARDAWLIYADYLQLKRNPKGLLIMLEDALHRAQGTQRKRLRVAHQEAHAAWAKSLLGASLFESLNGPRSSIKLQWYAGQLTGVDISGTQVRSESLRSLLSHRVCEELSWIRGRGRDACFSLLAAACGRRLPSVQKCLLNLATAGRAAVGGYIPGLAKLNKALPKLRVLELRSAEALMEDAPGWAPPTVVLVQPRDSLLRSCSALLSEGDRRLRKLQLVACRGAVDFNAVRRATVMPGVPELQMSLGKLDPWALSQFLRQGASSRCLKVERLSADAAMHLIDLRSGLAGVERLELGLEGSLPKAKQRRLERAFQDRLYTYRVNA